MEIIQIEFGMPFKGQSVPREWQWDAMGIFNPNIDYRKLAKDVFRHLPHDGPSRVLIKAGDRIVGTWSRYNELLEQHGM